MILDCERESHEQIPSSEPVRPPIVPSLWWTVAEREALVQRTLDEFRERDRHNVPWEGTGEDGEDWS